MFYLGVWARVRQCFTWASGPGLDNASGPGLDNVFLVGLGPG